MLKGTTAQSIYSRTHTKIQYEHHDDQELHSYISAADTSHSERSCLTLLASNCQLQSNS